MKKADILKLRELHRGEAEGVILNFLVNYSYPARLMRSHLPLQKGNEDMLQAAMRSYVIGIAASVETFFRDLFVCLLKRDPGLVNRALKEAIRCEPANRLPQYLAAGVSAEEFAASASFQNADAINHNVSIAFSGASYFDALDQFEIGCEVPSARRGPARLKLSASWKDDLDRVFTLRHEFAHDANSKTVIDTEEMRNIETNILLICQMTVLLPVIQTRALVSEIRAPVILLIADLIADDWQVAS